MVLHFANMNGAGITNEVKDRGGAADRPAVARL